VEEFAEHDMNLFFLFLFVSFYDNYDICWLLGWPVGWWVEYLRLLGC